MNKLKYILRRLLVPMITLLIFLVIALSWKKVTVSMGLSFLQNISLIVTYMLGIAIWLSLAWVMARAIDIFFWELFVEEQCKKKVPRLIKDIIRVLLFFIAILGIVGVVFGKSVSGLLTASGVIGIIVGLAIKNLIADVFTGIAMNLDSPFQIGDYIYLHDMMINQTGKILEITWRTTRLQTLTKDIMVVPNRKLSTLAITNLSKNKKTSASVEVTLDPQLPTERAITILTAAAMASDGVISEPIVCVTIVGITEAGVKYNVNYWFDKDKSNPEVVKNEVIMSIVYNLQHAGLNQAIPQTVNYHKTRQEILYDKQPNPEKFIRKIEIFHSLQEEDWQELIQACKIGRYITGDNIVTLGDAGDSMFVLVEGLLRVFIKEGEDLLAVGYIISGQFFGEMSLLTGEPRSATVRAETEVLLVEIPKFALNEILHRQPKMIEKITQVIASRREQNLQIKQALLEGKNDTMASKSFSTLLAEKIKKFFGIRA